MDNETLETAVCPETEPTVMPEELPGNPEEILPEPPTDITDRLAADFIRLTEEFPELYSPSQLPDEVLQVAAQEEIPLLDAYLRHRWQEEKRVREAARQRAAAAQQSAGPLSRGAAKTDPAPESFLKAFRAALR